MSIDCALSGTKVQKKMLRMYQLPVLDCSLDHCQSKKPKVRLDIQGVNANRQQTESY